MAAAFISYLLTARSTSPRLRPPRSLFSLWHHVRWRHVARVEGATASNRRPGGRIPATVTWRDEVTERTCLQISGG